MAQIALDTTGNESHDRVLHHVQTMMTELYAAGAGTAGALTPATIVASGLVTAGSAKIDTGTKTATASSGAATLSKSSGVVTSESLTTAAGASYVLTLTNTLIAATDQVMVSVNALTSTGSPIVSSVKPGAGSATIVIMNNHATAAFNAAIAIAFVIFKA